MGNWRESEEMRLDPDTTVGGLLAAIPSSALVFKQFGIRPNGYRDMTLQQVCAERGIDFNQFLQALDQIDWQQELPTGQEPE